MKLVIKLSGKLVEPSDAERIRGYAAAVRELVREGFEVAAVVVGGGPLARTLISTCKSLGCNASQMDMLGIEVSRLKARLLAYALHPDAHPEPPRSLAEAVEMYRLGGPILVMGGLQPGQSTTTVAALVAEALEAHTLLVGSTVDGVYDRDPRRHPEAKLIRELTYGELLRVVSASTEPGRYELIDPYAASILERSGVETIVFNAADPRNLLRAAMGEVGSRVTPGGRERGKP